MSDKQKILLSIVILVLFSLLVFIMFSDSGLADLFKLKSEKDRLLQENARLKRENLTMYRMIERLKNDPEYIESIARKELGMIKKGEVILKSRPTGDENKKKVKHVTAIDNRKTYRGMHERKRTWRRSKE